MNVFIAFLNVFKRLLKTSNFFQHFTSRQQGHAGSKTLHQQNPPVLNWMCLLTGVDLYNGRKTVVSWCYMYDNNESARCCVCRLYRRNVSVYLNGRCLWRCWKLDLSLTTLPTQRSLFLESGTRRFSFSEIKLIIYGVLVWHYVWGFILYVKFVAIIYDIILVFARTRDIAG